MPLDLRTLGKGIGETGRDVADILLKKYQAQREEELLSQQFKYRKELQEAEAKSRLQAALQASALEQQLASVPVVLAPLAVKEASGEPLTPEEAKALQDYRTHLPFIFNPDFEPPADLHPLTKVALNEKHLTFKETRAKLEELGAQTEYHRAGAESARARAEYDRAQAKFLATKAKETAEAPAGLPEVSYKEFLDTVDLADKKVKDAQKRVDELTSEISKFSGIEKNLRAFREGTPLTKIKTGRDLIQNLSIAEEELKKAKQEKERLTGMVKKQSPVYIEDVVNRLYDQLMSDPQRRAKYAGRPAEDIKALLRAIVNENKQLYADYF